MQHTVQRFSTFWWEYLDTLFPEKHRKRNKHKKQRKEEIINKVSLTVITIQRFALQNLSFAKRWNTGCQGFKFSQLRDLKYGTLGFSLNRNIEDEKIYLIPSPQ
jgi:hypothetical protein